MKRLTERNGDVVTYIGRFTKMPGIDCAASMRVGAVRDVIRRLADFEDLGLEPEEIKNMLQAIPPHD